MSTPRQTPNIAASFGYHNSKKTVFFKAIFLLSIMSAIDFFKTRDKQRNSAEPHSDKVQWNAVTIAQNKWH